MTAKILKSQIKDEAEFLASIQALIDVKVAHLDNVGAPAPSHGFLDQFIRRTPRGDPLPDLFEIDYEVVDDTPPPQDAA